jgi:endonuclease/exonuclease/phosphatase family metal-dependent hydrolase
MAGDFNSYSGKDNYIYKWNDVDKAFQTQDYMTLQSPFFDLLREYCPDTFMPTCGNLRIDYMYVSKPVLKACTGVISQPDTYTRREHSGVDKFYIPSDHYPIIAEFEISKLK